MISLDQARELVSLLEDGKQEDANAMLASLVDDASNPLFNEVGKLTRQLHNSLTNFSLDRRVSDLATSEIPDAKDRLNFVIEKTETAANRTMDAVEATLPIADNLSTCLSQVRPQWNALMSGRIELDRFKELCHQIDGLLGQVEGDTTTLQSQLHEILMAQDFQDLTGQVIRRVIDLVHEVEHQLVEILTAFGMHQHDEKSEHPAVSVESVSKEESAVMAEGPIVNEQERQDKAVMQSQDDVDDLLSSLGF
ncbi:protein phosphatase [Veronia nyctiphanis]|uniref:Protein phosphatase CheZ n=1 Tax=Veronia nyctiphanis TaxID=1278244 RepID=A0A4Q0YVD8_9GAMM|nr:protein phosphatase CheZ [Veronia nyctiphanis]RXJ72931.1 protein phosphatase [Veronia nyctiphanis]